MLPPPPSSTLFPYTTLFRSVVACTPLRLNGGSVRANRAARTTGAKSGLQPAITMLMAKTSRVSAPQRGATRSEEHTSELQSLTNLVCRLLLEKKKKTNKQQ